MAQLNLAPDVAAARAFLDALESEGKFSFQTFSEGKSNDTSSSPSVFHGRLEEVAAILTERNNGGHGIFVMVNKGDLQGRKSANVVQVRSLFLDLDGAPLRPVLDAALPPHIVVESSANRWHAYWRIGDCPLDQFKIRQQSLAARFNGDRSVCDLPRVMRLPGFWHLKSETPFQTRLIKPLPTELREKI